MHESHVGYDFYMEWVVPGYSSFCICDSDGIQASAMLVAWLQGWKLVLVFHFSSN